MTGGTLATWTQLREMVGSGLSKFKYLQLASWAQVQAHTTQGSLLGKGNDLEHNLVTRARGSKEVTSGTRQYWRQWMVNLNLPRS